MKRFVKILALALAAMFLLSLAMPVFAARKDPRECKHKHTAVNWLDRPDCTSGGYGIKYCKDCGYILNSSYVGKALGHNWSSGKWIKHVRCTAAGSKVQTCSRCGKTRTTKVRAYGHSWTEWALSEDKTHMERRCNRCNEIETEELTSGLLLEDNPGNNTILNIGGTYYYQFNLEVTNTGELPVTVTGWKCTYADGEQKVDQTAKTIGGFTFGILQPGESMDGAVYVSVLASDLTEINITKNQSARFAVTRNVSVYGTVTTETGTAGVSSNTLTLAGEGVIEEDKRDSLALFFDSLDVPETLCNHGVVYADARLQNTGTRDIRLGWIDYWGVEDSYYDNGCALISGPAMGTVLAPGQTVELRFSFSVYPCEGYASDVDRFVEVGGRVVEDDKKVVSNRIFITGELPAITPVPDETPGKQTLSAEWDDVKGYETVNGEEYMVFSVTVTNNGEKAATLSSSGTSLDPNEQYSDHSTDTFILPVEGDSMVIEPGESVTFYLYVRVSNTDKANHVVTRYFTFQGADTGSSVKSNVVLVTFNIDREP